VSTMNRIHNVGNPHQGKTKKVLCVCSAGLLRSPTAAVVLSADPFNYNTRAVGLSSEYALIVLDAVQIHWADEIVCMSEDQQQAIVKRTEKPVKNLSIPDRYAYRDPELMAMIREKYEATL